MAEALIKLDDDHSFRIIYDDETGEPILGTSYHPNQDGEPCFGTVEFKVKEWTLLKANPLTISPSIVCDYCDSHAIIRDGIWNEFWKTDPPANLNTWLKRNAIIVKIKDWLKNHWGNE